MKPKIYNLLVLLTSMIGYLEWGGNNHIILFKAEVEIISKVWTEPLSVLHPFTILPFIGQLLLLITLFQKKPHKTLTFTGLSLLGLLLGFMFIIGILSLNGKIICSCLPFLLVSFFTIRHYRRHNKSS